MTTDTQLNELILYISQHHIISQYDLIVLKNNMVNDRYTNTLIYNALYVLYEILTQFKQLIKSLNIIDLFIVNGKDDFKLLPHDKCNVETIADKIKNIVKGKEFYIGTTTQPENRILKHKKEKNLNTMHLVCLCYGKETASYIEKQLIERFNKFKYIENQTGGGEGVREGWNFIYVMTE